MFMDKELIIVLFETLQRIEQKLDALICDVGVDEDDLPPSGPFGRERDNGEVL